MTNREFYTAVIEANVNDELTAFATAAIEKMDMANEKRKGKPSKATTANMMIREQIVAYVAEHEGCVRDDIASALEISPNKVSALLAREERVTATDTKVEIDGKKCQRKAYALVK